MTIDTSAEAIERLARIGEIKSRHTASEPGIWEHWGDISNKVMVKGTSCCICDIRGWGYYTGGGSLNLPEDEAIKRQFANKDFIANAHQDIPYLLEQLTAETARADNTESALRIAIKNNAGYIQRYRAAESALTAAKEKLASMGWRTDWENAPKDGRKILVARHMGEFGWVLGTSYWFSAKGIDGWISTGLGVFGELGLAHPTHFMLITPPDVTSLTTPASQEGQRDVKYLVWSNEHGAWWRPDRCGYTNYKDDAGRYSLEEAEKICRGGGVARAGSTREGPYEVMQVAPECEAFNHEESQS